MLKLIAGFMMLALAAVAPCGATEGAPELKSGCAVTENMTVADLQAKGDALRRDKEYDAAIQCYRAALRMDRNSAVLYNRIGLAELQLGRYRQAQSDFEIASKKNRQYASALNNLGVALFAQKNLDQSAKNFKKALALKESEPSYHANLGSVWFAQGKMDKASAEYMRALELDPTVFGVTAQGGVSAQISGPEERAKYEYLLAKLYAKRGDHDRALESLKKAKENGYTKLGDVYLDAEFATLRQDARLAELIPPVK